MTTTPIPSAIHAAVVTPLLFAVILMFNGIGHSLHWLSLWGLLWLIWLSTSILRLDLAQVSAAWGWLTMTALAYVVWLIIAPFASTYPSASSSTAWALATLPLTFLGWLISPCADRRRAWQLTWRLLLAFGVVLATWGIIDFVVLASRSHGPLIDANAYAALINLFLIPVAFAYLVTPASARSYENPHLLLCLIALLALALFMSQSRGAIFATFATIPFVIWLARTHAPFSRRLPWVFLVLISAYVFVKLGPFDQRRGIESLLAAPTQQMEKDPALAARLLMWKSTWRIVQDSNPLIGTGLGTYKTYYIAYREELETSGNLAHNDYLQALQEGGVVQLGFFLVVTVVAPLWLLYRIPRRTGDQSTSDGPEMATGLALGILCISVHATINFVHYVAPIAMLTGLYLARGWETVCQRSNVRILDSERTSISAGMVKAAAITLITIPTVLLLLDGAIFKVFSANDSLLSRFDPQTRFGLQNAALVLRPGNPAPRASLIQDLMAAAKWSQSAEVHAQLLDRAEAEANILIESAPGLAAGRYFRGKIRAMKGADEDLQLARDDLEYAVERVPPATGMRLALVQVYRKLGQGDRAYRTVRDAKKWVTIEVDAASLLAFAQEAHNVALGHGDQEEARFWSSVTTNVRTGHEAGS